mgnify:CR=1 FL=1|tara:strand:+ start:2107 stop:2865 length:759 start_codon:yes stop_codon:yes gene_type:complete
MSFILDKVKLYNDDCFNVFPKINDKSINLFLLDLPFGTTSLKWDSLIDLDKMWVEIKRMMKSNAIICFFCTTKFGYSIIKSNEKWFKYDLIWEKSRKVGFLSANKRQLRKHENIYVFKKEQGIYNPQKTPRDKDYKHSGKRSSEEHYGNVLECKKEYKKEDGKHPTSIIENTILEYNNPQKPIHRTEKPIGLLEYLIKTYTEENDLVMDFTMGSGSCGEACLNTKRNFIGVELDKEIYELAKNRIDKVLTKL